MTNQIQEDDLSYPWMVPLLQMVVKNLTGHYARAGTVTLFPWITNLSPRQMARLLIRLLKAAGPLDLATEDARILLRWLRIFWDILSTEERERWTAGVQWATNVDLPPIPATQDGAFLQVSTCVVAKEGPTT